jgi:glutamine synthetase
LHFDISSCETYSANDAATNYNKRSECREILYREKIFLSEPWFGIKFAVETKNEIPHQSIVDAFYRACLDAGVKICSASALKNQWKFQIGPCVRINVGDDLWMSRFLLQRLTEKLEINVRLKIEYVQIF